MFRVGVFQTHELCATRQSDPEMAAVETVSRALNSVTEASVTATYARQPAPTESPSCASQTVQWWAERSEQMYPDLDAAILLTDAPYGAGGCAAHPDHTAIVAPGQQIRMGSGRRGQSMSHACLWVVLHEVGHALGGVHDVSSQPGNQSAGEGWIDSDGYHMTPMLFEDGVTNACGQEVPRRPDATPVVFELQYGECFKKRVRRP